jgi:hypothetical protein
MMVALRFVLNFRHDCLPPVRLCRFCAPFLCGVPVRAAFVRAAFVRWCRRFCVPVRAAFVRWRPVLWLHYIMTLVDHQQLSLVNTRR